MDRQKALVLSIAAILVASCCALVTGCDPPAPGKNDLASDDPASTGTKTSSNKKKSDDSAELGSSGGDDRREPSGMPTPASDPTGDGSSPSAPSTCTKDKECGAVGRICDQSTGTGTGTCIKGCRTDAECSAPQTCSSSNVCAMKATAVECTIDEQCELGRICTNNACVPGCHSTFDCPLEEICQTGQCVFDNSVPTTTSSSSSSGTTSGTTCVSDGQCNPGNNGSGTICSTSTHTCVPGCRQDYHCPGLEICVDGQCR